MHFPSSCVRSAAISELVKDVNLRHRITYTLIIICMFIKATYSLVPLSGVHYCKNIANC